MYAEKSLFSFCFFPSVLFCFVFVFVCCFVSCFFVFFVFFRVGFLHVKCFSDSVFYFIQFLLTVLFYIFFKVELYHDDIY